MTPFFVHYPVRVSSRSQKSLPVNTPFCTLTKKWRHRPINKPSGFSIRPCFRRDAISVYVTFLQYSNSPQTSPTLCAIYLNATLRFFSTSTQNCPSLMSTGNTTYVRLKMLQCPSPSIPITLFAFCTNDHEPHYVFAPCALIVLPPTTSAMGDSYSLSIQLSEGIHHVPRAVPCARFCYTSTSIRVFIYAAHDCL